MLSPLLLACKDDSCKPCNFFSQWLDVHDMMWSQFGYNRNDDVTTWYHPVIKILRERASKLNNANQHLGSLTSYPII